MQIECQEVSLVINQRGKELQIDPGIVGRFICKLISGNVECFFGRRGRPTERSMDGAKSLLGL